MICKEKAGLGSPDTEWLAWGNGVMEVNGYKVSVVRTRSEDLRYSVGTIVNNTVLQA